MPALKHLSIAFGAMITVSLLTACGGPQDDLAVTSSTSATLLPLTWSQADHRMTLNGVPFGPFATSPLEFEIRIEGLEPYEP